MSASDVLGDLTSRGLVHDSTDPTELRNHLDGGVGVYHGIDPTASSLHVGNLIGVLAMRRFQMAGHTPFLLVGGATGMVGDPSGRSDERNLLDVETLEANVAGIRSQLERLVDFDDGARLVNNLDWTSPVSLIEFLRDVGKHVTVNQMVAKESVRARMAAETGISFTEFTYMLLQAFDFWWLHENEGVTMQVGGSDQWGNITAGIDLVRRRSGASAHGLTWPLITRADGAKFGKTAEGTVWLDPERTLPYEFHQYFLRVDDADVARMLLQLTFLSPEEIEAVMVEHTRDPAARVAQGRLADAVTTVVHGAGATRAAALAGQALFGSGELSAEMLGALHGVVPETTLSAEVLDGDEAVVDLLTLTGLSPSRSDARRQLAQGAVSINREKVQGGVVSRDATIGGRYLLLQRGKKARHLVTIEKSARGG
ncbi:MAG: tyrosine--tRNA ligase [Acidimicrobiales bacterium]